MGRCRRRRHREGSGHSVAPRRRRHPGEAAPGRGEAAGRRTWALRGRAQPGRAEPSRVQPNRALPGGTEPYRAVPGCAEPPGAASPHLRQPQPGCKQRERGAASPRLPPTPFLPFLTPSPFGGFWGFRPSPGRVLEPFGGGGRARCEAHGEGRWGVGGCCRSPSSGPGQLPEIQGLCRALSQ